MTNKKQGSASQRIYEKRDLLYGKRDLYMAKETYTWQKRPIMWLEHQSKAPKAAPQQKQKRKKTASQSQFDAQETVSRRNLLPAGCICV